MKWHLENCNVVRCPVFQMHPLIWLVNKMNTIVRDKMFTLRAAYNVNSLKSIFGLPMYLRVCRLNGQADIQCRFATLMYAMM